MRGRFTERAPARTVHERTRSAMSQRPTEKRGRGVEWNKGDARTGISMWRGCSPVAPTGGTVQRAMARRGAVATGGGRGRGGSAEEEDGW
jgi:hypothetical protein